MEAADGGSGCLSVKIARAYLGQLPLVLSYDVQKAMMYYQKVVKSDNPDGHYVMSQMLLIELEREYTSQSCMVQQKAWKDS